MIKATHLKKKFKEKTIFDDFSLTVKSGEFLSITGESGKGKTTLINLLSLLEKPDSGDIEYDGIKNPDAKQTMLLRRNEFGYLFQNYSLINNETVEKNILLAIAYKKMDDKKRMIQEILAKVGLSGYEKKRVYTLSGGQQQRVALARVIAKDCKYIFADEPTGNLDIKNRDAIFQLLLDMNNTGKTIIMVTHDLEIARATSAQMEI
ncbi:putative ABC transport system ATP-binding protein [Terribacillus halophilus]|uniref:Putative ABC transport system ATP-binding protein n=1 Tax=Terribacillus halophilus TaxID=361279 RepID=A0A1G6LPZ7_9BACI|nr:ATP-binding cassette domain-containing protein [Terribacillus halophilus]SDC45194.1 putative ABC transport system ATP-binding protein [Terribacillus halophilus]